MKLNIYKHIIDTYEKGYEWSVRGLKPSPSMLDIYETMDGLLRQVCDDDEISDREFKEIFVRMANLRHNSYMSVKEGRKK